MFRIALLFCVLSAGVAPVAASPLRLWGDSTTNAWNNAAILSSPGSLENVNGMYIAMQSGSIHPLHVTLDSVPTGVRVFDGTINCPPELWAPRSVYVHQYWFDNDPDWEVTMIGGYYSYGTGGGSQCDSVALILLDGGVESTIAVFRGNGSDDYSYYGFGQEGNATYLYVMFNRKGTNNFSRSAFLLRTDAPTLLGMAPAKPAPSIAAARFASSGNLNLHMTMPVPGSADFSLYNSQGRMVQRAAINSIGAGAQSVSIDTKDIASGQYYLKSTIGKTASVLPVVKVK